MVKVCEQTYPVKSAFDAYFQDYPFPLSPFQKHAIEAIVEGHHVLVTAHTGSGKTLPAEFAIRHFVQKKKKVIYTSPIKALSNQKYYEFSQKFPDISIGLFTGDIKTNPEADVLIMTTEILMNTLFNHVYNRENIVENTVENMSVGESVHVQPQPQPQMSFQMDFENELAAVVFDEVHYINDEMRGQVWEKSLMMLPVHVQKIMLSATIDNAKGFAEWCESVHPQSDKQVYLSTTSTRVVPLSHYGFMIAGESNMKMIKNKEIQQEVRKNTNKLIPLQNDKGVFDPTGKGYLTLMSVQKHLADHRLTLRRSHVLNQLVLYLRDRDMLPAIAFVFSRKNVEVYAKEITIPLLSEEGEERTKLPYKIQRECEQIIRRLPNHEEYLQLPEYIEVVRLLEKGIGIHHSGMIPILREIVELCISKKYVKLLFATESFAIGLDCPIKTVVFTSLTKFDGKTERLLEPHEYTQMAGRAGRRGIDTVGHVVHCNNIFKIPDRGTYLTILRGKAPALESKFQLSYDLVLNVIKSMNVSVSSETSCTEMDQRSLVKDFMEKSMMHIELMKYQEAYREKIDIGSKELCWCGQTPQDICEEYSELVAKEMRVVNKKRKEVRKRINEIEDIYSKTLKADMMRWKDRAKILAEHETNVDHLQYLEMNHIYTIERICKILVNNGFLQETKPPKLTELGEMASYMAEIHPMIWSSAIMKKWDFMRDFTVKQMVGVFSCATDVKVSSDVKRELPHCEDGWLQSRIVELCNLYVDLEGAEHAMSLENRRGEEYELMFDIIDESMAWCDCSTELECKEFIHTRLTPKGISTGDFAKAMLKVATITREMSSFGLMMDFCKEQVEWLNKLSQIEGLVLKYIVTNQSLYV